jgi:hypothetical protein
MPPRPGAVAMAAMGEVSSFIQGLYVIRAQKVKPCAAAATSRTARLRAYS